MTNTVRVGQMPGQISEYAFEAGTTLEQALEVAGLSTSGYEVKVDGSKVTDLSQTVDGANLILLVRQIKGNAGTVRIGQMPGQISEYALEDDTTIAQALDVAGLSTSGYEVKVDGTKVTDFSQPVGSANLILLVRQIKGNK